VFIDAGKFENKLFEGQENKTRVMLCPDGVICVNHMDNPTNLLNCIATDCLADIIDVILSLTDDALIKIKVYWLYYDKSVWFFKATDEAAVVRRINDARMNACVDYCELEMARKVAEEK